MSQFKRIQKSQLKKKLIKKYKVIYLFSTRYINKINNETYYHQDDNDDDDDSFAIIKRVNDDCLAEIFKYIPACERSKIALVCKQWKRALDYYSWDDVNKLEMTHWRYDEYSHFLIKNYPTIDGQFNFLKLLLNKCGRYLRELDLTAYSHCNIVPVITESCPNLVKLQIRIKDIDDAIFDNAFKGSKLQVLKMIFECFRGCHSRVSISLINSLLNLADTLTELHLSNWSGCMADNTFFPDEITGVVSQLKALKIFQIGGINSPQSLNDLVTSTDSKLLIINDEWKYLANKFSKIRFYRWVKKLVINTESVTDEFLYSIANNMEELASLQFRCKSMTDAGMVAISKMNNLTLLNCIGDNNVTDSSIKLLKNLRILALPYSNKITDKSAIQVLKNSPNLKYFRIDNTGVSSKFIKIAAEISRSRKVKLELVMACKDKINNIQTECQYLTLKYVEKDE